METTIFLGITFRSASHLIWFVQSMVILLVSMIYYARKIFTSSREIESFSGPTFYLTAFHGITILQAIVHTRLGRINGPIYSVDCIWFNSLMVLVYLSLGYAAHRASLVRLRRRV
ncbi:MAG: hypothetical protein UW46_C0007G0022 [Candidatus Yanofskybacteria bacterium GW2011_GWF1_44_227]|uniref:Uncharacterized protein n=1 Tax=Candidatus Yanofskybacteria bacterium GW2011_GWE2_40_11 TaxID=1619033 RepID=A0A0G0QIM0_9BACT|nr:MAG: hypothetical protein UT69_C0014G0002 [Candidatus Yanofskybacteria bacterium GW2011_GWE1_40_10]KKR39993.1 MAG: hypothetical protein UT75_C0011G0021 [Candidatus Yanofskybacteria bacterium GW2011_GWE2_40_11]KKT15362.1 MAG: hypothetical protein UV97_C0008G0011 [Candidatus Yanofskybacteria bacterium GW2011_GWF2_43_596]KKT53046.1 MAG: hypothetical protein UW46_C0007G0022 [Candidatus Yanofskybacteria bacterium GW2011_GWF1_44_227]